jgi:hypothetical protein
MTVGKASALVAGLVGAMAFGVWIGPHITDRDTSASGVAIATPATSEADTATPGAARAARRDVMVEDAVAAVSPTAPALHERLEPVLPDGTKLDLAADGFKSSEEFASVAYASRNTQVPFVLLKHRVLNEGRSLGEAIALSKPDLNAEREVALARAQARADLLAVGADGSSDS